MITITPAATIALKDTGITPNPNPVQFAGIPVACSKGAMVQDVVLAAASTDVHLTFPVGVATAAILAIYASTAADLTVNVNGQVLNVPMNQPMFLYGVAAIDVSVSSALGGKMTVVVGG